MSEPACEKTCDLPKSGLPVSPRLDQAFELRYRGNRMLRNTPVLHVQAPRDKLRADYALPSQEVSGIQLRIPMRPRDRDTAHHSLDEVLRVSGEIFASGWPGWSAGTSLVRGHIICIPD